MSTSKHSWSKRLFHRKKKLSPPALATPSTAHSARSSFQSLDSGLTQNISKTNDDFLEKVLQLLEPHQRSKIELHMLRTTDEIGLVLDRTADAAREKRLYCEQREWKWTYRGREIKLRDVADRLVSFIDKFKSVGDTLADIDPIHMGLPWAGIKLILEVTTSETKQMSALLFGVETALYMSRRLQVYLQYFISIPVSVEKTNFEETLLKFYACILAFLADFIEIFEKNTASRILKAVLNPQDCEDFERKCDQIAQRTENDASNCDRLFNTQDRWLAQSTKAQLDRSLAKIQDVKSTMKKLNAKIDLSALPTVDAARYEFHIDQRHATCLEGTREDLLKQIDAWARHPDSETIFWLSGMAGTGKSTIARTVATRFAEPQHAASGRLGATYFFKRGEGDRGHARKFFTTLAAQLADKVPSLREPIARCVEENPDVTRQSLKNQYEKLVFAPLSDVSTDEYEHSSLLLIIDALDECDDEDHIRLILHSFQQAKVAIPLRIFVTSRPELPIRLGFASMTKDRYQNLVLHEIPPPMIEHDIAIFLEDEFARIRSERSRAHPRRPYASDWPGKDKIEDLVMIAAPLFIFAATMCRFIGERRADPAARLAEILQQASGLASKLDQTYLPILKQLLDERGEDREGEIERFKRLVGPIVIFAEPLSISAMSRLLNIEIDTVDSQLDLFHSVLNIPGDDETPVRLLHLSFRDFLTQQRPNLEKHAFSIDEAETHGLIAKRCLELLSQPGILKRDLLSLVEPGIRRKDVDRAVIKAIPAEVAYAASYWVYHLQKSDSLICDADHVHDFLRTHFLHWLEALSWLDLAYDSAALIDILVSSSDKERKCDELTQLLQDARQFCDQQAYIADLAPLQLYVSALIFTSDNRPIKRLFRDSVMVDVTFWSTVPDESSSRLKALTGHSGKVNSIAFSLDGAWILSASVDRNIKIWSAKTLQNLVTFRGHEGSVLDARFSPDNQHVASCSVDGTVRIWSRRTKREVHVFTEEAAVEKLCFNRDGKLLFYRVNYSDEIIVRDTLSGQVVRRLTTMPREFFYTFSTDGTFFLASQVEVHRRPGYYDNTGKITTGKSNEDANSTDEYGEQGYYTTNSIKVRSTDTGELVVQSERSRETVWAAEFSTDNRLLIIRTDDYNVRLLRMATCEEIITFDLPSKRYPQRAAISADSRLVSVCGASQLFVFEAATGNMIAQIDAAFDASNVLAFSPDGTYLISAGSVDGKANIFPDIVASSQQAEQADGPGSADDKDATNCASYCAFAPDGQLVGVAFQDKTIRIFSSMTGEQIQQISTESPEKRAIFDFSFDSQLLLVNLQKELQLRRSVSGELLFSQLTPCQADVNGPLLVATISPDGQLIAFAYDVKKLHVFRMPTGEKIQTLEIEGLLFRKREEYVKRIQISPDSKRISMRSRGSTVLWDIETGNEIASIRVGLHDLVTDMKISNEGLFAAWTNGSQVFYKDLCSAEEPRHFDDGCVDDTLPSYVGDVTTSPDDRFLITTDSARSALRFREVSTGTLYYELILDQDREHTEYDMRSWGPPRFVRDGTRVQTDLGFLDIPSPLTPQGKSRNLHWWTGHMGNWICKRGRQIIWMPPEYRYEQGDSYGNAFAFMNSAKHVTFLNIEAC